MSHKARNGRDRSPKAQVHSLYMTTARTALLITLILLGIFFYFPSLENHVMARWGVEKTIVFASAVSVLVNGLNGTGTASGLNVVDLSKSSWTVTSEKLNISVPGRLPSVVHLDLFENQKITDPYFGLNDFNLRWIGENNWTYSAVIEGLDKKADTTWLLFNGLDTFTSIEFCFKHVASTNNQFRQYAFDVTEIFRQCNKAPRLSIDFGSAPLVGKAISELPGQETWPSGVEGLFEYEHRQFVRKEQSDFGWDWGPAFVPAGPWLPAFVVQNSSDATIPNNVYVRNALVDIYRLGQLPLIPPDQTQPWVLNISLDIFGSVKQGDTLYIGLRHDPRSLYGYAEDVTVHGNTVTGSMIIDSEFVDPYRWWPNGLGEQNLWTLDVSFAHGREGFPPRWITVTKKVGFRTIVLNQEPIRQDQLDKGVAPGANWQFLINGHEFYAKGSNFIPPDAFWPRVTEKRMRALFSSVVAGNQNMLRVWASGAYLPDFIYDIADEMGVLLWSEFQFGDALYPVDQEFLDNIREEANYQVRRINHHPSLALWAGGNELENLELQMVRSSAPQLYARYVAEYEKLFLETLVPCVFENSRSISYTPSSTSNGWESLNFSSTQPITQRYDNKTFGYIYGDTDYYNYDSYSAFNFSDYPAGRFSNEFGYHSMPSLQSWKQAVAPEDLWFNSTVIRLRNHHYPMGGLSTNDTSNSDRGMIEMTEAVTRWYPTPNKLDPASNFSAWIHGTQIFQADFYKSQIQFYRRGSGMPERQLGSLYWQLEDIWQAPTWAGIEYDGRWKVLHYIAKDVYRNVIISPFYDHSNSTLQVYVTSDLWSSADGNVTFSWYDWSGNQLSISTPGSVPLVVEGLNTTKVLEINVPDMLQNHDPSDVLLRMETLVHGSSPNFSGTNDSKSFPFSHENWFHAAPLSEAKLVDPGLTIKYNKSSQKFTIGATKGVAAWVWIDYPGGVVVQLDANGFWLRKGERRDVGYKVISGSGTGWIEGVTVQSLWNMTTP